MIGYKLYGMLILDKDNKIITNEDLLKNVNYGLDVLKDILPKQLFITAEDCENIFAENNMAYNLIPEAPFDLKYFFKENNFNTIFGHSKIFDMLHKYITDLYVIQLMLTDQSSIDMPNVLDFERPYMKEQWLCEDLKAFSIDNVDCLIKKYSCYITI